MLEHPRVETIALDQYFDGTFILLPRVSWLNRHYSRKMLSSESFPSELLIKGLIYTRALIDSVSSSSSAANE